MRLGIDIGATKTAAVIVDDAGSTRGPEQGVRPGSTSAAATDAIVVLETAPSGRGPAHVVRVAAVLAERALGHLDRQARASVQQAGACMPGLVDPVNDLVRNAVNLEVERLRLGRELTAAIGLDVSIENDVKAAALGAARLLAARESQVPVAAAGIGYLNLGTGLAAAVVLDGRLVRGAAGAAGEIGHIPVGGGVACRCGQTGCLETIASGSALTRLWPAGAGSADPFQAAAAGDHVAAAAAATVCRGVALAIQVLVVAAGVEHVVVGGGLAALGAPLSDGIRAALKETAAESSLIEALDLPGRFELLTSDVPLGALGAAHLGDGAE
jgi:predicted NBD/HSP70 family sugar kinase